MAAGLINFLVLSVCCLGAVYGLPNGAPEAACTSMQPGTQVGELELEGHTTLPQNQLPTYGNPRAPPFYFQIFPEHTEWVPGEQYSVSVVANQTTGSNHFLGIILQARSVECQYNGTIKVKEEPLGSFDVNPVSTLTHLKLMECHGRQDSSVCHKNKAYKINETVWWTAPDSKEEVGDIAFRATIVRQATIYWTGVTSPVMRASASVPPPTCGAPVTMTPASLLLMGALCVLNRLL